MRLLAATLFLCLCAGEAGAETCVASHYGIGDGYHGKRTASGERFNAHAMTAAHRTLPFGTVVSVCLYAPQLTKGHSSIGLHTPNCVTVRINDRGPFVKGRCIDLSTAAMRKLCGNAGTCKVTVSR
jgi:rare lipoprotein A